MRIFQKRKSGGYIPTGVSWQWAGGPMVFFMPKSRAWRFRFRLRFYNKGYKSETYTRKWRWNLGIFVAKTLNAPGAPDAWNFEWAQGYRPTFRKGASES